MPELNKDQMVALIVLAQLGAQVLGQKTADPNEHERVLRAGYSALDVLRNTLQNAGEPAPTIPPAE